MAEEYSISQLTEDTTAHDSDLIEVSKDNGDGTYASRKQTRATLLEGTATQADLDDHQSDTANPHNVTKVQVGLGNVPDVDARQRSSHTGSQTSSTISDFQTAVSANADVAAAKTAQHIHANKSVLDATTASFTTADESKLDGIASGATTNETDAHLRNRANHTGTQTASTISDFTTAADARITAQKGQNNGLASLDSSGKVPSTQLPSYVDDVVEATSFSTLPGTGTAGIIYVTIDTNKTYRWSGSAYVEISPSPGSTDAVPEGSTNKYFTDSRVSANSDVAANTAARHSHNNKSVLDATTASFTTDDETKLDGIAPGATANSTDATLLNRSNHTGTQAISSVAGLQSALDGKADDGHAHIVSDVTGLQTALDNKADVDAIPTLPATIVESVVAGANVTIDNSDPSNPVISSTGGGGGGGAVDSVNGQTGVVVLDADDLSDDSTSHKFATATQLANADSAVQPGDLATVATSGDYADLTSLPTIPDALTDLDTTVTGAQLNDLKNKVDGIEEGAQVNEVSAADIADFETTTELDARDTANRNRANHTGEQPISSITGLQTAIDGKAASSHTHAISDVTNLQTSLDGKAPTSHTHDITEILNLGSAAGDETDDFAPAEHTHAQSDITNLTTDLAGKQDTLVSGTNIKTINGSSLLGSGDVTVSGGMTNPMTTAGDVIYGGVSGAPTRLAKGTAGQVLTMNAGATAPQWSTPAAGGGSATPQNIFVLRGTDDTTNYNKTTAGTGAISVANSAINLTTGASATSSAYMHTALNSFNSGASWLGPGSYLSTICSMGGGGGIGIIANGLHDVYSNSTGIVPYNGYGFTFAGGTPSYFTANGGTRTTATFSTPSGINQYTAVRSASNIKFYCNKTLVATVSTNLPDASAYSGIPLYFGVTNKGFSDQSVLNIYSHTSGSDTY